jgi:hypothetical protein
MVRDDLELRIGVHDLGEDEARQRHAGLVGPAEHAANLIFRFGLALVVDHLAAARGMQQDRLARFLDHLVERPEFGAVDRLAVDVGAELHGIGAILQRPRGLLCRGRRRVHRHHRRIARETVGMFRADFGQPVVGELRHVRRLVRTPEPVEHRQAEREDLRVVGKLVDHLEPQIEIVERRDAAHALADVFLARGRLDQGVEVALGAEMTKRIDVAHAAVPEVR